MIVAITLRESENHRGRCDLLERSYVDYFSSFGITLLLLPNKLNLIKAYFEKFKIDRIILIGGGNVGNIKMVDGKMESINLTSGREMIEKFLIEKAIDKKIPVLGICRGFQFINIYFGGTLDKFEDHCKLNSIVHEDSKHGINIINLNLLEKMEHKNIEVNSFHSNIITSSTIAPSLVPFAIATDGTVEAVIHKNFQIAGIMWHPERDSCNEGINRFIVESFINKELFNQLK